LPDPLPVRSFDEVMADVHKQLIQATGAIAAAWDETVDNFRRTVTVTLPKPDVLGGRCWTGDGWSVQVSENGAVLADCEHDVIDRDLQHYALALLAADRMRTHDQP
jgi:hypothetical protein